MRNVLEDASDGAEAGSFEINTRVNGQMRSRMFVKTAETVFNDDSLDLDFRVESNNKTNMFVVDAGDDVVKIGGITGSASWHAQGQVKLKSSCYCVRRNSGSEVYSLGVVADGSLIFANSGTEVVRFNDSGNVVLTASAGDSKYFKITDVTHGGDVRFGIADGVNNDAIAGAFSNNSFVLFSNSAEKARILADGRMIIGSSTGVASEVLLTARWKWWLLRLIMLLSLK